MKHNETKKRFLAFLLSAAMIVTYMPTPMITFASENSDDPSSTEVAAGTMTEKSSEAPAKSAATAPPKETAAPASVEEKPAKVEIANDQKPEQEPAKTPDTRGSPAETPADNSADEPAAKPENSNDAAPAENSNDAAPAENSNDAAPAENSNDAAPAENSNDAAPAENSNDAAPAENGSDAVIPEGGDDAALTVNNNDQPEVAEENLLKAEELKAEGDDEVTKYTVKFYNRDGEVIETRKIEENKAIGTLPAKIERENYIAYWAVGTINSHGSTTIEKRIDSSYIVTKDVSVVPDYDKITYTVSFYKDKDDTAAYATRTVDYETNYCLNDIPAVPTQAGTAGKWVYSGGDFNNNVTISGNTRVWADYEKTEFTVTFVVDGNTYQTDKYYSGDKLSLPPEPVVEGKDFVKWVDKDGKDINGGEEVTSDLTITAVFTDEYTVSFVIKDGDEVVETLSQYFRSAGEAIGTMPQDPFVAGKVFEKWVDESGNEVTAATVVNKSMVVEAQFREVNVYKITAEYYYLNDRGQEVIFNTDLIQVEASELPYTITAPATTQTASDQVSGAPIYYPSTPTVTLTADDFEGDSKTVRIEYVEYTATYNFVYMLLNIGGDKENYDTDYTEISSERVSGVHGVLNSYVTPAVKNIDYAVLQLAQGATITQAEGQNLYVYYTRKNFSLSYESNGGSYVSGGTYAYGEEVSLSSTVPTRAGYTFDGWYTDEDLQNAAGSKVTIEGDTTLYAKWKGADVNYTIVYMFEKYNDAGTQSSYVYENSETGHGDVGSTVHATDASIPDKTKTGWVKDDAKNATSSAVIAADGSTVLFVYYKLREYTFQFNAGTFSSNWSTYNVEATLTGKGVTGTGTLSYTMTVKLGQDISSSWPGNATGRYNSGSNNRPNWHNVSFNGWYNPQENTRYVTKRNIVTPEMLPNSGTTITYTARWTTDANTYTVNYWLQNADDDNYTKSEEYSQTYTSSSGNLGAKEIPGYTYDHGNSGASGVTTYNFYYNRDVYKIDYFYGSNNLKTINNVKFDATITGNTYNWTPTAAQCGVDEDYTFEGWYSDSGLTAKYTFSTMPASNLVLYAKWTAPSYTVSFVDGDDTSSTLAADQTVKKYEKATRPADPSKPGFIFEGWFAAATGDDLFDWNTQIAEDTTVYAHWTRATLSYTVRYVDEDGEEVAAEKVVTNPNFVVGQEVSEAAIAVAGYRPKTNNETLTLSGTDEDVITFVYVKKSDLTKYVVRYIIDPAEYSGNIPVAEEKLVEEVPGDTSSVVESAAAVDYTALYAAHPELKGIEFYPDKSEKSLILTAVDAQNILTFYYSSYKHAEVKVNFVDANGASIHDADVQMLKVGKTFTLSRTPIAGWEFSKAVVTSTGAAAENSYKITEAVCESGLEFTLVYKKKATITVNSNSKQYDGTALTLPSALADQVVVDGLLSGDSLATLSYTYAGADNDTKDGRINAGTATVTPKGAVLSGAHSGSQDGSNSYYSIRYISGTLEVTKINVTVRVEPDRWTGEVYDGKERMTGFTNPDKDIEDYVMISHAGYAAKYLDTIWAKITAQAKKGGDGLGYYMISEKDADDYTYNVSLTPADLPQNDNYSVNLYVRPGRLQILPKDATISTGSAEKAYDGTPLTEDTAEIVGLVDGDSVTLKATGTITDPGSTDNTYSITWDNAKESNYKITETLGTLTVTTASLVVTVKDKELAYNGSEQSGNTFSTATGTGSDIDEAGYTVKGLGKGDVLTVNYTPAKGTEVGEYNNGSFATSFTIVNSEGKDVSGNYKAPSFNKGKLNITPADDVVVTITGHNNTADYDGEEHSVSGYDVEISNPLYKESDFEFKGTAEAKRTDAGQTNMGLAADQFVNKSNNFKNVTFKVTDGYQKINPIDVTVTIVGHNNTADYDGEEHVVKGYDVTIGNKLYKEADFTFSGTAEAKRTDAGQTNMGLAADQFKNNNNNFKTVTFNVTDGYQKINPIDVTVTIVGHNNTTDYDGEEHSVSGYDVTIGNKLYTEDDFTFNGTDEAKRTDAGQTNMGLAADQFANTNDNFKTVTFNVTDGYQKINPIDVTVTIVGNNDTRDYDGTTHEVEGYKATASSDLYDVDNDIAFTGEAKASRRDVGTSLMGLAADQFANKNSNFKTVTFEVTDGYQKINPIDVTVTIVGHNNTTAYDGEEHSVSGYDVTIGNPLYKEADFTFEGTAEAKRTDAGQTDMGLAASQFKNTNDNFRTVTFEVTDGYQKINPIDVTVTITGHFNSATFDNKEHSVSGYDVQISNPLYKEADFTFSGKAEAKRTEVGKTMMELAADQFANKNSNFKTVTFEVTDGYQEIVPIDEVKVTIVGHNNTADYDGKEHSVSGYDVTISNPLYKEADFTFSGTAEAKRTDAGTTNMGLAAGQFKNNNKNFKTVTFEVTDGYQTINPIDVTVNITGHSNTTDYDGKEHSVSGYDVTIGNPLYKEADFTFSGKAEAKRTDAGQTDMGLAADQFKNKNDNFKTVTFNITDGYQKINPIAAKVTVTENSDRVTYDGKAHTIEGYKSMVSNNDLYDVTKAVKETKTDAWTVTKTNAGTYDMGIVASDFENIDPNFTGVEFEIVDGQLIIDKYSKKVTVTVTENSDEVTYDGKAHTITGFESMVDDNDLYDVANVRWTKTDAWTVSRTDAGSYDMGIVAADFENTDSNFSNVVFEIVDGKLVINRAEVKIVVADAEKTYGEKDPAFTGTVTGLVKEGDLGTITYSRLNDAENAGTYNEVLTANYKANNNYIVTVTKGNFTIKKAQIPEDPDDPENPKGNRFQASIPADVVYNGKAQRQPIAVTDTLTGKNIADQVTIIYSKDVTNVGTVNVTITAKEDGNYTGSFKRSYRILPAPLTIKADNKTKVYGSADPKLTASIVKGQLFGKDTVSYDISRKAGENVGSYTITAKNGTSFVLRALAASSNYYVKFLPGTMTITRAPLTITTGSATKVYDGTALTSATAGISGLVNGDRATVTATGSRTIVGSSNNTYSIAWTKGLASNYIIIERLGTLTVTNAADDDDNGNPPARRTPRVTPAGPVNPTPAPGPGDGADPEPEVIPDEPTPEAEPAEIPDNPTPLAEGVWALINLIAAILTALGAIVALFRKKEDEDEEEDDENAQKNMDKAEDEEDDDNRGKKMLAAKIAGAIAGIAAPIVFILTEDMSLPMALIDKWTLLMIVMLAAQIVAAVLNKKASKLDDDEEEEAEPAAN